MNDPNWHDQQTRQTRRPRRLEEVNSAEVGFPIAWVLIGALSGLLVIGLIGLGVVNILRKQSIITPTPPVIPGIVATIPSVAETTPNSAATPTIPPVVTLTPTPSPTLAPTKIPITPTALAVGVYARVIKTDGAGISLRSGPGTNNARLSIADEGAIVSINDGPKKDENGEQYTWWFVHAPDGGEGWVVQDYLEPSLPPKQ